MALQYANLSARSESELAMRIQELQLRGFGIKNIFVPEVKEHYVYAYANNIRDVRKRRTTFDVQTTFKARMVRIVKKEGETEMAGKYHKNGHDVYFDEESRSWKYADNGQDAFEPRSCPCCHKFQSDRGHDACLGELPGVHHACCGHGTREGYIYFENGASVKGPFRADKGPGK